MKPGIYHDMPDADYRAIEAMSYSTLKQALGEGAWMGFKWWLDHEKKDVESAAMVNGRLVNTLVLEREKFYEQFHIVPGGIDRRMKDWKLHQAEADSLGKKPVKEYDLQSAMEQADAVWANDFGKEILTNAAATELTLVWEEPTDYGPILCKGRIDIVSKDGTPWDLKTSKDNCVRYWRRTVDEYRYDLQAGAYCRGLEMLGAEKHGWKHDEWGWLTVCTSGCPLVRVYHASCAMIEGRKQLFKQLINEYAQCLAKDVWPDPMGQMVHLVSDYGEAA